MLAPNSRALLTKQLAPPPGYRFDAAVGTTFTLDFGAALLPPLSFSGLHDDGGTMVNSTDPVSVLESLRRVGTTMDIFCQPGEIHVPTQSGHEIFAFLEPIIHEVAPPKAGLFHPKVWFVRFADVDGDYAFRLLVQSRNLTFDNSWEKAVETWLIVVEVTPVSTGNPAAAGGRRPPVELLDARRSGAVSTRTGSFDSFDGATANTIL